MSRRQIVKADGTTWCDFHRDWHPVEDFRVMARSPSDGGVTRYAPRCKVAEQTIRDRERELDPARTSIVNRAKDYAGAVSKALGVTVGYQWVMVELHWSGWVPFLQAAISHAGTCLNCGVHHDDPAKYQLAHKIPGNSITDWAAYHARNFELRDACNQKQGSRSQDRAELDRNHRDWMAMRHWATHAGTKGWPPYEPSFGARPLLVVANGPVDHLGNPVLFG